MAPAQAPFKSVWTPSNMKARLKGHIAIRLYKLEEAHPTTKTKNTSHKCCAAALCNNRSDNRKGLTFHVFSKDLSEAPGISFGVNFNL